MKLINSTDFQDKFLLNMILWISKEVEIPYRFCKSANFKFTNGRYWIQPFSGLAEYYPKKITVRISRCNSPYPYKDRRKYGIVFRDRVEALVSVTAHELEHLDRHRLNMTQNESLVEYTARICLKKFINNRTILLEKWNNIKKQEIFT